MSRPVYLICSIGLILAFSALTATWVREEGRFLVYTDLSYRASNEYFLDKERVEANDFVGADLNLYADYGLSKNYTIGIYFPLIRALSLGETQTMPSVTHINIGDLDIIQRLQIASLGGAVFNLELLTGIPTGNAKQPHGLHTGDGEYNFMPGFSMGWGFSLFSLPSYLTFYSGINIRGKEFSDELHYSSQWGLFVYKKALLLSLEAKRQVSRKNKIPNTTPEGLWNNTSYWAHGLGITYKFDEDTGMSFYYKTLSQVENSLGGDIYSLGFFHIF